MEMKEIGLREGYTPFQSIVRFKGARDARPHVGSVSFIFMQFLGKSLSNNILAPHWRIQGGVQRCPLGSNFFYFYAVLGKKLQNRTTFGSWRPPPTPPPPPPPPQESHRSAAAPLPLELAYPSRKS